MALEDASYVIMEVHQSDRLCEQRTPTKLLGMLGLALPACVQYACNLNLAIIPPHETSVPVPLYIVMARMHHGFVYDSAGPATHVKSAPSSL